MLSHAECPGTAGKYSILSILICFHVFLSIFSLDLYLPLAHRSLDRIYNRALDRGFNPEKPACLDRHVEDTPRAGRPTKQTEQAKADVEAKVTRDRYGREKSADVIAVEVGLSPRTVLRVLQKAGYRKTKPTRKPGLTEAMKKARLAFCRAHVDKGDDFWHNIIWTDETSIILGHRRGGYRVWRKSNERVLKSVIRPRWKGFSEFMFWGSFTYKERGPCHIYPVESAPMKKQALKDIEKLNETLEPVKKAAWEQAQEEKRKKMKRPPSVPAKWKWDKDHGKLSRSERGGIDWYRYWKEIQTDKLIPLAERVNGILIEDGAGCHKHWYVQYVYSLAAINRLVWCGNSPDLNAIEPLWGRMKRETTEKGAPQTRADGVRKWKNCWNEVPQEVLRGYVDRIREHMKRVIECEGGNEYEEGLKTRETKRKERIEKREQEKVEKERRLQEMLDQQSQVRLVKKDKQARAKEFLAQERLKDKEKERKERESVRNMRLKELERLREQRAQQKMGKKQLQQQKLEQRREQRREQQRQREQREQELQQRLEQQQQKQPIHHTHERLQRGVDRQREQMELDHRRQREQIEVEQQQQRAQQLEQVKQRQQAGLRNVQRVQLRRQELRDQDREDKQHPEQRQRELQQQLERERGEQREMQQQEQELLQQLELQHEEEIQQQIEREIAEMERHDRVEILKERKRGKAKQLPKQPEQPQERQTRVLRRRERQGNVDVEGGRPEVDTERKKRGGKAKQLPKQPEQPEPPQVGHSRVLRKR